MAPRCPEAFRCMIFGQKVQKIVTSAKQKHIKFERNFVEKSKPTPIKRQATTHHAQHTTHDIQHTTRPIEFARAKNINVQIHDETRGGTNITHATCNMQPTSQTIRDVGGSFHRGVGRGVNPLPLGKRVCRIVSWRSKRL